SAIRTLVDLSVLELIGKATNTPYWRCIPNGTPDPVVVENMRAGYNALTPELKLGLIQVTLRKYGEPVQVTQKYDDATRQALEKVYAQRYPTLGAVDVMTWQGFEPLFFGVPMAWDTAQTPALAGVPPVPGGAAPEGAKAGT
ncbi:MAG: hypothetical protein EOO29_36235, partial [Comamonadaceae bacterium]